MNKDNQENQRKIIHIDMDAFYASVEQRDFPHLRNKPVIVGGSPNSRGVVAACSYEARKFGIHSAMASSKAYQLCPEAIFVKPRFDAYKQVSVAIRKIFSRYAQLVEPLSLDEAYLDVSQSQFYHGSATLIAKAIRKAIFEELHLTASAGISYNKFLAKLASDENKPNGQFVILPEKAQAWIVQLPIRKFFGIGKATEKKMHAMRIHNGQDLKNCSQAFLEQHFGKAGLFYYQIIRGIDHRAVKTTHKRQSIGSEITFESDITDFSIIKEQFEKLSYKLAEDLEKRTLYAQTLTIKIKYANFQLITRSISHDFVFCDQKTIAMMINHLLEKLQINQKIRLIGLAVSNFQESKKNIQMTIFDFSGVDHV